MMAPITVGVLALQGGVGEHLGLLRKAATHIASSSPPSSKSPQFDFLEVRTTEQLAKCDALIIPGGESTTMAIVARRLGLFDPLRQFVKVDCKPVWGTCAGLVMLAEEASAAKQGGQELVGGLDVRVLRNRYGTQIQSFVAELDLPFLGENEAPFRGVFIRAPIVEEIITSSAHEVTKESEAPAGTTNGAPSKEPNGIDRGNRDTVEVMAVYKKAVAPAAEDGAGKGEGDIVAVRQRNVFGTSFHPELTDDIRIHVWWLKQVLESSRYKDLVVSVS